jgi:hypothetical protein
MLARGKIILNIVPLRSDPESNTLVILAIWIEGAGVFHRCTDIVSIENVKQRT